VIDNHDVDGPAKLAATTLIAVCLLYDDVHNAEDVARRAVRIISTAMSEVAQEVQSREQ
jgi:hypothetical protein